jgi:hypothetical protein
MKKNSTFSHVIPSFSLKATFGIKSKGSNKSARTSIAQDQLFNTPNDFNYAETTTVNGGIFTTAAGSDNKLMHSVKANTAPGRYGRSRSALPNNGQDSYGRSTSRSKLKSTPEYFVHLLQETHVRDLEDAEVLDLRVFLRSVVVRYVCHYKQKSKKNKQFISFLVGQVDFWHKVDMKPLQTFSSK